MIQGSRPPGADSISLDVLDVPNIHPLLVYRVATWRCSCLVYVIFVYHFSRSWRRMLVAKQMGNVT